MLVLKKQNKVKSICKLVFCFTVMQPKVVSSVSVEEGIKIIDTKQINLIVQSRLILFHWRQIVTAITISSKLRLPICSNFLTATIRCTVVNSSFLVQLSLAAKKQINH